MGTERSCFSLVSMGEMLVAVGGLNGRPSKPELTDVVEVFYPEKNEWKEVSCLPSPKIAFSAVVVPRDELTKETQELMVFVHFDISMCDVPPL